MLRAPDSPRTVNQGQNDNFLLGNSVHEAIGFDEQFSNGGVAKLRDHLAPLGKLGQRRRRFPYFLSECCRVIFGVSRDVLRDGGEIVPRRIGPLYFSSHRAMRRSASSCEITAPWRSASSPFWIFWRT